MRRNEKKAGNRKGVFVVLFGILFVSLIGAAAISIGVVGAGGGEEDTEHHRARNRQAESSAAALSSRSHRVSSGSPRLRAGGLDHVRGCYHAPSAMAEITGPARVAVIQPTMLH